MRGYQKRLVCLKKTGSPIIEEAYFLLSDGVNLENGKERFLKEANRIIEENGAKKKKKKSRAFYFCLGAALSALILSLAFIPIILTVAG